MRRSHANNPMLNRPIDVIAAGHICLDLIPALSACHSRASDLFTPGKLVHVGPAAFSLGGSVANTGLALHRLGARTRFVGKVGNDLLGKAILESLSEIDSAIPANMIVAPGEPTSYSIVLSPPGTDRGFLHCPGTNDTFVAADLDGLPFHEARILHFGYPPLMRGTRTDEGQGLAEKFAEAQAAGVVVSLDMAAPSHDNTNWRLWLRRVLPHVDLFLPSLDELLFMLDPLRTEFDTESAVPTSQALDVTLLDELSAELHELGSPIVGIKLGDQGLYLSSRSNLSALASRAALKGFDWSAWEGRKLLAPCFDVQVAGTTGSGDCTIAGFLLAVLHGFEPAQALRIASAVGAYSVGSNIGTNHIPPWSQVTARLQSPWRQRQPTLGLDGWEFSEQLGVYVGPRDSRRKSSTSI
jgi:sugar/nucleoside kinase (ribokinase family)